MRKDGWIALLVFLADRGAKTLARGLPPGGRVLIPGVLALRPARNTGMAFSLLSGHPALLAALSAVIIAGAAWLLRGKTLRRVTRVGLMMMLGGALGNLTDRVLTGAVPDMIEPLFVRFAVFNVADACLVAGCGLVMLGILREK
ncbi:MAG: signal peptidase II [Clostridia bacterium]|nr:signal peptidase II [Clostridia bacterium]